MIDIETLDTKDSAIVLSIGGCVFNGESLLSIETLKRKSIYLELNPYEQETKGRTISVSTLFWWVQQKPPGLNKFIKESYDSIKYSLNTLNQFITENDVKSIWSKSPSFDMIILTSLFNNFELKLPIDFRNWYDVRTINLVRKILNIPYPSFNGEVHNALDDAANQALVINEVVHHLKSRKPIPEIIKQQEFDLVIDLMEDS